VAVRRGKILHEEALSDDGDHRVLLWSSATLELRTLAGDLVSIPSVSHAVAGGDGSAWLTPKEAAHLGLPEDTAVAGLARLHTDRLGDWTVAVVSSIQRHSGREARRYVRTIVVVSLASMLAIEVCDRGAGIDPALIAGIRPFFSTKAEGEGTGLGLAIASEVMRMHRGALTLGPRPGGGTCAVLRLPVDLAHNDHAEASEVP